MDYGTALKTYTPEQWQSFGARGGTIGEDMNLYDPNESSIFGLGNISGSQLGGYTQLGGLAYEIGDDLLGTGGKAKKQQLNNMKKSSVLLDQQIANNAQSMADKKAFNEGMAKSSNNAMGLGTIKL
jgi:hypothetical protein